MIRTVIADDEPLARQRIKRLLADEIDIEVVAEPSDGYQAVAAIRQHRPDLVFLDVQMPELDGFTVLRLLDRENAPVTIFTTAYDQYALQAFEANALDYLLKPYDEVRFRRALQRARVQLQHGTGSSSTLRLVTALNARGVRPQERLVIKSGGRVVFLDFQEVDWVEAAANYVRIHAGTNTYLLRQTISAFSQQLPPDKFMRIHRSIIVNLSKIKELQPCNNGEYIVVLRNGRELSLSRSFRGQMHAFLHGTTSELHRESA
jgi:two-component system, LytTR family, response regulator